MLAEAALAAGSPLSGLLDRYRVVARRGGTVVLETARFLLRDAQVVADSMCARHRLAVRVTDRGGREVYSCTPSGRVRMLRGTLRGGDARVGSVGRAR